MQPKRIGIICALEKELEPFLKALNKKSESSNAKFNFHSGNLFNRPMTLVQCGVAKVNAAIATQQLIEHFKCDLIILSGTAGALCPSLRIKDTVVPQVVYYHDVDDDYPNPSFKTMKVKTSKPVVQGGLACGEFFIKGKQRKLIRKKLDVVAVDMESASVGHVCSLFDIPFIVVKSVTDCVKYDSVNDFFANLGLASKSSFDIVADIMYNM